MVNGVVAVILAFITAYAWISPCKEGIFTGLCGASRAFLTAVAASYLMVFTLASTTLRFLINKGSVPEPLSRWKLVGFYTFILILSVPIAFFIFWKVGIPILAAITS